MEIIARYKIKSLVLVILTPFLNTPMQDVVPPSFEEIEKFFAKVRAVITKSTVILGCARPMGEYKITVDRLAVDNGFDGTVFPSDGIVSYAQEKDLKPLFTETCCGVI